jgi:hypothetical protein
MLCRLQAPRKEKKNNNNNEYTKINNFILFKIGLFHVLFRNRLDDLQNLILVPGGDDAPLDLETLAS